MQLISQSFRLYVAPDQLSGTIAFYEELQQIKCEKRISFPQAGVEVAVIGGFILLAGGDKALDPVRHVQATLTVDSLEAANAWLERHGAAILGAPRDTPAGRNLIARNPDGLIVEYFEAAKNRTGGAG
jgi:predicted enzyme related to lactoylglutathione lyase